MNFRKIKPNEFKTFLKIKKCIDNRKVSGHFNLFYYEINNH